jgi:hypothetical protein
MERISLGTVDAYVFDPKEMRPCDGCTACCTTIGVQELHKRNYTPCPHECEKGCAIYGDHPLSCKTFNCWWKVRLVAGERPDKSGIIVDSTAIPGGSVVRVWEHIPGALKWKSNQKIIDKLQRKYGLVIQGTKGTWGKIWIDDAPPSMKDFMDEMINAGNNLFQKLAKHFRKEDKS